VKRSGTATGTGYGYRIGFAFRLIGLGFAFVLLCCDRVNACVFDSGIKRLCI